jgi:cytochrome d ubiquinol oxidase subunit I
VLVAVAGHDQAQWLVQTQPMKMAASEGLWEDSPQSAPWTVVAAIDVANQQNGFELKIPGLLSLLSYNKFEGQVRGMNSIQAAYEQKYGPGNYIPPVKTTFWSFRVMIFAGTLMIALSIYGAWFMFREWEQQSWYLRAMIAAIALPYIANSAGWIMTEVGRQPWTVFGILRVEDSVSPTVSAGMIWISLIGFTLIYGILAALLVFLFVRTIRKGAVDEDLHGSVEERQIAEQTPVAASI